MFDDKTILITGGTGSFGKMCTHVLINNYKPRKVIIYSRDELKQFEMSQEYPSNLYEPIRFFLGDIRDKDRLKRAFYGVDYVIHAAALKQVPAAEYNPFEVVKTNVLGAQNIIDAAIDSGVSKVMALSTDKAANPINLYGATKLCSDKLFIAGNAYASKKTRFSTVRYGNVMGSRGSVIPFFLSRRSTGVVPITHPDMTRFWISLERGVDFVLRCLSCMVGGELFVPKIPSMRVVDLAKALCPDCRQEIVGVRPGEKIHEIMISAEDSRNTLEFDDFYLIKPFYESFVEYFDFTGSKPAPEGFEYNSGTNPWRLSVEEMKQIIEKL